MNWSNHTWQQALPIYQKITAMPFIEELMDGSLPVEKFQYYIAQDSHYLEHFAKALSLIAARMQDIEDTLAFIRFAEGAIIVEAALHESYFIDFNVEKGLMQPACHHYSSFLKSTAALENIEVAAAAVLPCFWIYKEVGNFIYKKQSNPANPYKKWIDTYAGEDFALVVNQAISICDKLANSASRELQKAMTEAFLTASKLEFDFWDSAYNFKSW